MSQLFCAGRMGTLELSNRLVRSATAECLADEGGRPKRDLTAMYRTLVRGGVGLIITGHMYVHLGGRTHLGMTGIYDDALVPALKRLTDAVHEENGRIVAQINHGGAQCQDEAILEPIIAPSAIDAPFLNLKARAMTVEEINTVIDAFAKAAGRVKEAGFDGVQIHAAHGYLISQFLSPAVNRRTDRWGGDIARRMGFLESVAHAIRSEVGPRYPVLIKLGMKDAVEGGLTVDEAVKVVAKLEGFGIDALEISGGIAGDANLSVPAGIRAAKDEAFFRPLAQRARPATSLPILLVGGLRSQEVMEEVLGCGDADFVSLCRPLICEPDLPKRMEDGRQTVSACVSGNRCWPEQEGEPIACKCPNVKQGH